MWIPRYRGGAIDLSGSTVELRQLKFRRIGIGAVTKDASLFNLHEMVIKDARIGLAAYVKKPETGVAELPRGSLGTEGEPMRAALSQVAAEFALINCGPP